MRSLDLGLQLAEVVLEVFVLGGAFFVEVALLLFLCHGLHHFLDLGV